MVEIKYEYPPVVEAYRQRLQFLVREAERLAVQEYASSSLTLQQQSEVVDRYKETIKPLVAELAYIQNLATVKIICPQKGMIDVRR